METKQAADFYEIQDAVAFNVPVDEKNKFYTDFSNFRADFHENIIFKHLNINPKTLDCNVLKKPKKIFLSGYKGTGKTSELFKLNNRIHQTNCYFSIFVDISEEELDTNNIETVDILILMLEKLVKQLKEQGAQVSSKSIESFYNWYAKRITEINSATSGSATIEIEAKAEISLAGFLKLLGNTKGKLQASKETKETIRQEFSNNFSDFSTKFNQFIFSLKEQFQKKTDYKDILFIIDGFEKIGSLEDRKKILVDDSNKFTIIATNMLITLPIELFSEKNVLNHFSTTIEFPLIDLTLEGAKERFKEFILKRVHHDLFADDDVISKIITFGAGHPRQTLRIINDAFVASQEDVIDMDSVTKVIETLGRAMLSEITEGEIGIIKKVSNKEFVPSSDVYTGLKAKNIILDYGTHTQSNIINPIVKANRDFQRYIAQ